MNENLRNQAAPDTMKELAAATDARNVEQLVKDHPDFNRAVVEASYKLLKNRAREQEGLTDASEVSQKAFRDTDEHFKRLRAERAEK